MNRVVHRMCQSTEGGNAHQSQIHSGGGGHPDFASEIEKNPHPLMFWNGL